MPDVKLTFKFLNGDEKNETIAMRTFEEVPFGEIMRIMAMRVLPAYFRNYKDWKYMNDNNKINFKKTLKDQKIDASKTVDIECVPEEVVKKKEEMKCINDFENTPYLQSLVNDLKKSNMFSVNESKEIFGVAVAEIFRKLN